MDLRQLGALTAVADHHSFSAAARALHTVQSNVSTHVARLEDELGVTLIDRSTGRPTDAGELVVARARRVQRELDALAADVASALTEVTGSVRVGIIGTTARWLAPLLLGAMRDHYPRVQVVVVDATTTSLLPQLVDGQLDLAVVNLPVDDSDVDVEALFDEDHIVVAPAGHPLAQRDRVTLSALAKHPVLLEPSGTAFRDELDEATAAHGLALTPLAEIDGMRLLASLAFNGFGPAVLPASAAPAELTGDWKRVRITGLPPRSVGIAVGHRGLLPAPARVLRDMLRDLVLERGPHHPGVHVTAAPPPAPSGSAPG